MTRDQIKELLVGAIATVPTPFNEDFQVNYPLMEEATENWIQAGLVTGKSVIKVAAAMGEGPQLREEEGPQLLSTVVRAAKGRVPVVYSIHHKDTLRTIEDAKQAQSLGAVGLQISPPIFNHPSQDDILRFYEAVSDGIDVGILVYNTHWFQGGAIYPETFRKMTQFENVVVIKWSPPEGIDYEEIFSLADVFNIIDNSGQPVKCHMLGGKGFVADGVAAFPPHYLSVWDLLQMNKYEEAQLLWDKVNKPLHKFFIETQKKSGGEARIEKALCTITGLPVGVSRPPSLPLSNGEITELRKLVISWGWPVTDKS